MEQLSKHFSLDYLVTGSQRQPVLPPTQMRSALDEAVVLYSEPIRAALKGAPDQQLKLHDLISKIGSQVQTGSFDQFLGVIRYLQELKFVQIVTEDPFGNHLIKWLR